MAKNSWFDSQQREEISVSPNAETGSGTQPTLYPIRAKVSFPLTFSKVKATDARR
jgi:hypothetical protein